MQPQLQLYIVVQQPHLLAGLEGGQSDIRTPIATERISQSAVATRPNLALDREIKLVQIVGVELGEVGICICSLGLVFGFKFLGQTACTVLACSSPLAGRLACLSCRPLLVA